MDKDTPLLILVFTLLFVGLFGIARWLDKLDLSKIDNEQERQAKARQIATINKHLIPRIVGLLFGVFVLILGTAIGSPVVQGIGSVLYVGVVITGLIYFRGSARGEDDR